MAAFEATRAVRFDIPHGSVHASDGQEVALVPVEAINGIAKAEPAAAKAIGEAVGQAVGRRVTIALGDARAATIEVLVGRLAGELAVLGFGVASVERWGRALVVRVDEARIDDAVLEPLLGAAIGALGGKGVATAALGREGATTTRVLIASQPACTKVASWIEGGTSWGDALTKLHTQSPTQHRGDA